jgi:hypothetical protein
MKQIVKCDKTLTAYKVNNENDLDEFVVDWCGESVSIHKVKNEISISEPGQSIIYFEFGDWIVIEKDGRIETYTDEEFNKYFTVVV